MFKRTNNAWAQEAYLKAPNAESNDLFGFSTAISGDTIVVGAYVEDSNQTTITNGSTASSDNSANSAGAAYVFRRNYSLRQKPVITSITPRAGAAPGNNLIVFGQGFMSGAKVKVGEEDCASITVQGPNEIICTLPESRFEGPVDVVVINPQGAGSSTLARSYTYP